jgi:hypothetical protein
VGVLGNFEQNACIGVIIADFTPQMTRATSRWHKAGCQSRSATHQY